MELKDVYTNLYNNIVSGKYDIVVADAETFEMTTNISFVELLSDCNKEGVNLESFLRYLKEQDKEWMGSLYELEITLK